MLKRKYLVCRGFGHIVRVENLTFIFFFLYFIIIEYHRRF